MFLTETRFYVRAVSIETDLTQEFADSRHVVPAH
jgi:hypothetical protein